MSMHQTRLTPASPDLVDRLRSHYGHHYTTTRDGIVTGEHHDFSRHPLVGEAIAEIERLTRASAPAPAEMPALDERKLWALLRAAVGDGASIQANNGSMAYDFITALLDGRAALRMRSLRPLVLTYAATRRAIVRAAAAVAEGTYKPAPSSDLPEDNYYKTMGEAMDRGQG